MDRTREKKFWVEFVKMYKAKELLWNMKHPAYKDRKCKKRAYNELAELMRPLYPDANVALVKRKINSMRSSYRRDRCRIRQSLRAAAETGDKVDEYQPTWWLFPHLDFLATDYVSRNAAGEQKEEEEEEEEAEEAEEEGDEEKSVMKKEQIHDNGTSSDDDGSESHQQQQRQRRLNTKKGKNRRQTSLPSSDETETFDMPQSSCLPNEFLDVTSSIQNTDACMPQQSGHNDSDADIYGRCWALQYKELSADQKIYAKKAIEDVFFEAKLGTLQRNSVKINGC